MANNTSIDISKAYDEYSDLLYRLALSHLGNREDAMDAVQDVFVKYVSLKRDFSDSEHKKAWFIRVTINRCVDLFRKRNVRAYTPLDETDEIPDNSENFLASSVKSMLDSLPEKFKTVIILHYLEGFSVEEISNVLEISVSAVKMRLARARDFVKANYPKESFYDE